MSLLLRHRQSFTTDLLRIDINCVNLLRDHLLFLFDLSLNSMLLKLLVKLEELTKRNDLIPHVFATFLKIVESFKVYTFFGRFCDRDSHLLEG